MRDYRYDHVHLRSPDPDATARFFETMYLRCNLPGSSVLG
jgi:hypothetical protein